MSIAHDDGRDAHAQPAAALHPLLALMAPPPDLERARAEEAAARELVVEAEAAVSDADERVPPELAHVDPVEMRRAAAAVTATRTRAVVAYRMLGPRPWLDADAEDAACRSLDALEAASATTAVRRRQSHMILAIANVVAIGLLLVAAFEVLVLAANPVDLRVGRVIVSAGALPVVAALVSALGVVRSARQSRALRPALDDALRRAGCRTVRELGERRRELDEWNARARHAAAAGDRCAEAIREWYAVAGVGADAGQIDRLVAAVEWLHVTRTARERARFAHKVAVAQLERACHEAGIAFDADVINLAAAESAPPDAPDALGAAVQRLRDRRALIRWR